MGNLAKRFATAGVLVPLVLLAIYADPTPISVTALAVLAAVFGYDEWLRMALPVREDDGAWSLRIPGATLCALVVVLSVVFGPLDALTPLWTLATLLLPSIVLFRRAALAEAGRHMAVALAGLSYVGLLLSPLALFKAEGRPDLLVMTLCLAFFSDTVAYFFGRFWGKRKLYEAVSPKKTRAGAVGGLVGGVLATTVVGAAWIVPELPVGPAVGLGIAGSVAGQIGDLVESMAKRTFGVKDSGHLLPGHGGVLDRIDGLLFVGPVVYWFFVLSGY
ncbi:MAG: phosphatidate cytidylyltransferase [Deltaproteobacteria bacterium]|nr:MAG: phosphatidate cytidylyltransferase [Deltaproteobacteria bacterium]